MQRPTTPSNEDQTILKGVHSLVLFVSINVKDIARLGRLFPWKKPTETCPHCYGKLWWHGFVTAYFSCHSEAVYLRRMRCSRCGSVHRLRPKGYFRRFRSSIAEIKNSLLHRYMHKRWRPDLPRSRQRQWWRRLLRLITGELGASFGGSAVDGFILLFTSNMIPVTNAKNKENRSVR